MFDYDFTDRVRRMLTAASEEAMRLRHECIGTEHLLLGLVSEDQGIAAATLARLGVPPASVRAAVLETLSLGSAVARPEIPYTARATKVLELAANEVRELRHRALGGEHLLLGLLRDTNGAAAAALAKAGLTYPLARAEVACLTKAPD